MPAAPDQPRTTCTNNNNNDCNNSSYDNKHSNNDTFRQPDYHFANYNNTNITRKVVLVSVLVPVPQLHDDDDEEEQFPTRKVVLVSVLVPVPQLQQA